MSQKKLFSLLNSNWMFSQGSETIMYPYLFKIINGEPNFSVEGLPNTVFSFFQNNGNHTPEPNTQGSVAVIKMHHPIFKYDQLCGPQGTQSIMKQMDVWKTDNSIKGVLLDKNTGGGQASGCSEWAEYVHNYPKPVGTYTNDTVGSAGYYGAAAGDFIMMNRHADYIGCIGSMCSRVDMKGVLKKQGATIQEFYADISTEKNLQARELENGNERPLIEKFLNPLAEKFKNDMKLYRPQITEKALKGDVFNPEEALKEGLIDEIGNFQDAIDKIFELSKTNSNSNNKNMSNTKVPLIEAILGADFSNAQNESGFLLTDVQAEAIENELKTKTDSLTETTANLKTANDLAVKNETELKTANENATVVTNEIQKALVTAEVANADKLSNQEGVVKLSDLVTEYGAKDGGKTTEVLNTGNEISFTGAVGSKLNETLKSI